MCFSYECWQQHFWLRSVPFINAIAVPMPGIVTSSREPCDEPQSSGDEKFRKGVQQDKKRDSVTIALRCNSALSDEMLSFLEN
jgi:hypothetical protein